MKMNKRLDEDMIYTRTLRGNVDDMGSVLSKVEEFLEKWEASPKQTYYVQMAIEEVCSAIINNGFVKMPENSGLIQLTLVTKGDKDFSMFIRDNAVIFNLAMTDFLKLSIKSPMQMPNRSARMLSGPSTPSLAMLHSSMILRCCAWFIKVDYSI